MKKIFTKATIKNLISGSDELLPKYMKVFNTYRDLCGDDINLIHQSITGYAVVHKFGRDVNVSEFRSREAAHVYMKEIAEAKNISISKRETYFENRVSSWQLVRL